MVLAYIGIAIGVLIVVILIVKISRTSPREVAGIDVFCKKCGLETRGICPKCEKKSKSFGV
jgi:hypothetical protein